jgi:hypothetical protein
MDVAGLRLQQLPDSMPWLSCFHAWLLAVQPCTALLHL